MMKSEEFIAKRIAFTDSDTNDRRLQQFSVIKEVIATKEKSKEMLQPVDENVRRSLSHENRKVSLNAECVSPCIEKKPQ
jgi:hypothetical protein